MPENKQTDWIEITRAAKYPQGEITEKHLELMLEHYSEHKGDPDYMIPAIPGHTKDDNDEKPGMAWISELKKEGKSLWAKFLDETGEFMNMIKSMPKRSIEAVLSKNFAQLKAVAFGSVMTPAAKGMSYNFSDTEENVSIKLNEEDTEMDELKLKEINDAHAAEITKLSEANATALQLKETEITQLKADAEAANLKLAELKTAEFKKDYAAKITKLSEDGKLKPADVEGFISLCEGLPEDKVNGLIAKLSAFEPIVNLGEEKGKGGLEKPVEVKLEDKYTKRDPRVVQLAKDRNIDLEKLDADGLNDLTRPIMIAESQIERKTNENEKE